MEAHLGKQSGKQDHCYIPTSLTVKESREPAIFITFLFFRLKLRFFFDFILV